MNIRGVDSATLGWLPLVMDETDLSRLRRRVGDLLIDDGCHGSFGSVDSAAAARVDGRSAQRYLRQDLLPVLVAQPR